MTLRPSGQLYKKYSVIKPQEKQEDLQKITHFTLPEGKSVKDTWIELIELGGRVVTANPVLASVYTKDALFEFFLKDSQRRDIQLLVQP